MRRLLFLVLLGASLLAPSGRARAQSTSDRLSLEALTAPQPGDGRGGGHSRSRSYHHAPAYRSHGRGSYGHGRYGHGSYRHGHYGHGGSHTRPNGYRGGGRSPSHAPHR